MPKKLFRYYEDTGRFFGVTDYLVAADNAEEAINLILSTYNQYSDKEKIALGNEIKNKTKEFQIEKSQILWDKTSRNDLRGHFDM